MHFSNLFNSTLPIQLKILAWGPYVLATLFGAVQAFAPERAFRNLHPNRFWFLYGLLTFLGAMEIVSIVGELEGADHINAGSSILVGSVGIIPAVILSFSALFRSAAFNNVTADMGALDSIYLSIVTFTTLGYGDITPKNPAAKVLTATLVLLSYILVPVILAELTSFKLSP